MTVEELKTALKRYGFDDTDPLLVWLNAAQNDLVSAKPWPWLEVLFDINANAGDNDISLPSNAVKIVDIRDVTHMTSLQYRERSWFTREIADPTVPGIPEVYTLTGMKTVQFYPIADETTQFQVLYIKQLDDLTAITGPDPPSQLHYAIVQRAAAIALQAENEEERAQTAQGEYLATVETQWDLFSNRVPAQPGQVRDVMGYGLR